jgi:hypothetical protein
MIASIIRQLPGCRPVTLCVIERPDWDTNNCNAYNEYDVKAVLESLAQVEIEKFKTNFVEFESAMFYVDYSVPLLKD